MNGKTNAVTRPGWCRVWALSFLLACTATPHGVRAQEASGARAETAVALPPGINDEFLDSQLNVEEWVARFEVESREVFQARHEIIKRMSLQAGERVADVGAGTGLFTPLLARQTGAQGWVFAVDISPRFVEHIVGQMPKWSLTRITPVLCTADSVCLPPGSIDAAFLCDVYHHLEHPVATMASVHVALKPRGRVFLVDFERIPGVSSEWVLDHVRAGKETVIDEMREAGFELTAERTIEELQENYFLEFRRVGTGAE